MPMEIGSSNSKPHHKCPSVLDIEGKMFKVEVISKELIKPSTPTPLHLRSFKLSLLDQLAPSIYIPVIFFYTADYSYDASNHLPESDQGVLLPQKLSTSLSQTLVAFYPLAGRIKDDETIDCNDEGVELYHARVNSQLSEFLKEPHVDVLNQRLMPGDLLRARSGEDVVPLAIQVNSFDCGGVAIGVLLSHKIADGTAMVYFISKWAAMAHGPYSNKHMGATTIVSASDLFPPRSSVSRYMFPATGENVVTRRFVFNTAAIAAIRAWATTGHSTDVSQHPTRVEAVSALIWRCFMKAKRNEGRAIVSLLVHAVNIRGRMRRLVPDSYFGNLFAHAVTEAAVTSECSGNMQGYCLQKQLRNAFRAIGSDFIEELKGPDGALKANEGINKIAGSYMDADIHVCCFTSWFRFPIYEVDFGWGKPIWVGSPSLPVKDLVIFTDRRWDDGMEVWVNLEAEEMARFEQDQELLSFVSIQ